MDHSERALTTNDYLSDEAHSAAWEDKRENVTLVASDITPRNVAEERLAHAQRLAHLGSWHWDIAGDRIWWSDEIYNIFGLARRESAFTFDVLLARVHPEDRGLVQDAIHRSFAEGTPYDINIRAIRPDGTVRVLHSVGEVVRNDAGKAVEMAGTAQDVTDRKLAEEALRESEQRFRQIAEHIDSVFWMTDPSIQRMIYVSPAYERTWGVSCASLYERPKSFIDAILPEDRDQVTAFFHDMSRAGEIEYRIRRPDGSIRWIKDRSFPVRDESGRIYRITGIADDVTERKLAEEKIRRSEAQLAEAQRIAHVGSWEWHIPANTVTWSDEAYRICGLRPGDPNVKLNYQQFLSSIHPDDRAPVTAAVEAALSGRAPFSIEYRLIRADGTIRIVHSKGEVVHDEAGKPIRMVGTKQDLTDSRQAHEELQTRRLRAEALERERAALQSAVAAMEHVLGVVAHELRTPLAAMRAIAEFLVTEESREMQESEMFLRNLHDEVVRMSDTVDSLLEAARINSGKARWKWSEFSLEQICDEAMETARPLVDASRVSMTFAVEPPGAFMRGDADAVRRLVMNLLSNARKYTQDGSIHVTAHLAERQGAQWVEIGICDTGRGIPPEIVSRLGEAFALNSGMVGANHVEGTGLGLSICKGIVAAHGGTINVESQFGHGTTITARLRGDLDGPLETSGTINIFKPVPAETPTAGVWESSSPVH